MDAVVAEQVVHDPYKLIERSASAGAAVTVVSRPRRTSAAMSHGHVLNFPGAVLLELRKIQQLETNWDGNGSPPIEISTVQKTLGYVVAIVLTADELGVTIPAPRLFPSSDGRIGLFWSNEATSTSIEVLVGDQGPTAVLSFAGDVLECSLDTTAELVESLVGHGIGA